jgi:hypothetical protein
MAVNRSFPSKLLTRAGTASDESGAVLNIGVVEMAGGTSVLTYVPTPRRQAG